MMNLEQFKETGRARYAELADTVATILDEAIVAAAQPYRYQHIERRAKSVDSLRDKLKKINRLDTTALELNVKDLAGCRVVFYSNRDVERFLQSGMLRDNFEIDPKRTKPHYPVPGLTDPSNQFRSDNIVVRLKAPRVALPEYARLVGLWCEVQVQTILNHSWSETAHNITYKRPALDGIGAKLFAEIDARLQCIMKQHLAPAGFAFQQVLNDYDRVIRAKALIDNRAQDRLLAVDNNNDRKDLLDQLQTDWLPVIDDLFVAFPHFVRTLTASIGIAKKTARVSIVASGGTFSGASFESYLDSAVEVLRDYLHADVSGVVDALLELYASSTTEAERSILLTLARPLSEQSLLAWKGIGGIKDLYLLAALKTRSVDSARNLPIAAELIEALLPGGSIPYGAGVADLRTDCVAFLQSLYDAATTETDKLLLINALFCATRGLARTNWFIASIRDTLVISVDVVNFCARIASTERLHIVRKLEHKILWLHRNFNWVPNKTDDAGVLEAFQKLAQAISQFRKLTAGDERFVMFKTIVGYDSVFPPAWDDQEFEIERAEPYRQGQIEAYVDRVAVDPEQWFQMIVLCAASVLEDGTTIGRLRYFLERIGAKHPLIAISYIDRADEALSHFYEPLLSGASMTRSDLAVERINKWIENRCHLEAISEYLRVAGPARLALVPTVLEAAIAQGETTAVYQCIATVLERSAEEVGGLEETVFQPALRFLTAHGDATWFIRAYARGGDGVYQTLSDASTDGVLDNFVYVRRIDHRVEEILTSIARHHSRKVIAFFVRRLREPHDSDDERYEPVPYEFRLLPSSLSMEVDYVVEQAAALHDGGDYRLRDQSARLVANIFPKLAIGLQETLSKIIHAGEARYIHFALDVLGEYDGDVAIHPLCKEIVNILPADDELLGHLQVVLWNSGMLAGEFGHVMSLQEKRASMQSWLSDEREKVRLFAQEVIEDYEKEMTSEQQRAENESEMRKLRYGETPAERGAV